MHCNKLMSGNQLESSVPELYGMRDYLYTQPPIAMGYLSNNTRVRMTTTTDNRVSRSVKDRF